MGGETYNCGLCEILHKLIIIDKVQTIGWLIGELKKRGVEIQSSTLYLQIQGKRTMKYKQLKALLEILAQLGHIEPLEYFLPPGYQTVKIPGPGKLHRKELLSEAAEVMNRVSMVTHETTQAISMNSPGGGRITQSESEKIIKAVYRLQQESAQLAELVKNLSKRGKTPDSN